MLCPQLEHACLKELLQQVGLDPNVARLYPYQLSQGMYKRVELIVAVASNPKILLLDEFYSSIDDNQKDLVRKFLAEKRSSDMTWIIAHEDGLRGWIGGPEFEFILDETNCVVDIKKR
jgi:ABC-type dipeptide/oligopeptide/nickel transport system ATPase subunit